jgi:hypothetical protein
VQRVESDSKLTLADMLVGHFTEANVESFVTKHASGWGNRPLLVRMSWGSKRLLTANVVQLFLREETSEIGLQHQAIANGTARPTLVRQNSPPLGIPLASMVDLQKEYQKYVQEVVSKDLSHYPSVAYDDQTSKLSECLLRAVCVWYQNGVAAGEKVSACGNPVCPRLSPKTSSDG